MPNIMNPRIKERDRRRLALERMRKSAVVAIWQRLYPNAWTSHPVTTWRKDEIIVDILNREYGEASLCGEPNADGTLLCAVGAYTVHGDGHRFEIPADQAEALK